jgi:hypothetical protein
VQGVTAPVSHQNQPERTPTNAIEIKQKPSKINKAGHYSTAHNGLVAGPDASKCKRRQYCADHKVSAVKLQHQNAGS